MGTLRAKKWSKGTSWVGESLGRAWAARSGSALGLPVPPKFEPLSALLNNLPVRLMAASWRAGRGAH